MAGRTDVVGYLERRGDRITSALSDWVDCTNAGEDPAEVVRSYFADTNLGDVETDGNLIVLNRTRAQSDAPNVLVIGCHEVPHHIDGHATARFDPAAIRGPGIGSRFGPLVAFADGFKAALSTGFDEPVNATFVSVGRNTRLESAVSAVPGTTYDAVFLTSSVAWDPLQPTLTVGARGLLVLDLELSGARAVDDAVFAGAVRNPLSKLTDILGHLRDDRGRIAVPGFYHRAAPPTQQERSQLTSNGFHPDEWTERLDLSRPAGSLSATERATMWPVVSIADIRTDGTPADITPASASATVAFHLVPDQRPVEIEAAVRSWFESRTPDDLRATISTVSMARPYRSAPGAPAVAAQARALTRVNGRAPVLIPGGGHTGAGEVHYASGAPVGFAGICGPHHGFGTGDEVVPRSVLELGIAAAAETCSQLPRRTGLRSTS